MFFSQTSPSFYVNYFYLFGLGFATWLIYFIDQILDYFKRNQTDKNRHDLNIKIVGFQLALGIILGGLTLFNYQSISLKILLFIALIVVLVCVYFVLVLNKLVCLKEFFTALIITLTIAVLPHYIQKDITFNFAYLALFLIVFSNLILLALADRKYDQKLGFSSIVQCIGKKSTTLLLAIILMVLLLMSITVLNHLIFWLIGHAILYFILLVYKDKIESHVMHFLTDIVLLLPLYYFL